VVGAGGHVRVNLRSEAGGLVSAMAFRSVETDLGRFLLARRGAAIHAAGSISANYYNGAKSAQFRLADAAEA
jgi:single-stranded-DNA-specific exonuclease